MDDATANSATVVCCGTTVGDHGYFYAATLLTGVSADALMMREEIFGPVAPIATFATEAEAIARANDTEYSLVAYVFTRDLSRTLLADLGQSSLANLLCHHRSVTGATPTDAAIWELATPAAASARCRSR